MFKVKSVKWKMLLISWTLCLAFVILICKIWNVSIISAVPLLVSIFMFCFCYAIVFFAEVPEILKKDLKQMLRSKEKETSYMIKYLLDNENSLKHRYIWSAIVANHGLDWRIHQIVTLWYKLYKCDHELAVSTFTDVVDLLKIAFEISDVYDTINHIPDSILRDFYNKSDQVYKKINDLISDCIKSRLKKVENMNSKEVEFEKTNS